MTLKDIWHKVKSLVPLQNKVEKVIDEGIPKAHNYTFTFKVSSKKINLANDVERLVLLNPWITIGSKPIISIQEIANEEKQVEVSLKAISKIKINLIEQQIIQHFETL